MRRMHCANDNHGRAVVTVRFCPTCGAIVNARILARECPREKHAIRRRAQSAYCVDCGEGLAQASGRR